MGKFKEYLKNSIVNEGKVTAQSVMKALINSGEMKEEFYMKKGNLVQIDTYIHDEDKSMKELKKLWSKGGDNYDFAIDLGASNIKIIDQFGENISRGIHKKMTDMSIVGVVIKIT